MRGEAQVEQWLSENGLGTNIVVIPSAKKKGCVRFLVCLGQIQRHVYNTDEYNFCCTNVWWSSDFVQHLSTAFTIRQNN